MAKINAEVEASNAEMDELAETWIGSDISRWEWHERLKSRRDIFKTTMVENEVNLEEEWQEVRHAFLVLDDMFDTSFLEEDSSISPMDWGLLIACRLWFWAWATFACVLLSTLPCTLFPNASRNHRATCTNFEYLLQQGALSHELL